MQLFLGNKKEIGVEIKVTGREKNGTLMGYARLWFGGNFLGSFYDYIYLEGYLLSGLLSMLKVGELSDVKCPSGLSDQFYYFKNRSNDLNDDGIDSYRISFGTLTDRFYHWAYKEKENITVIWRRDDEQSSYKDLKKYPQETFGYTMQFSEFKNFVERLHRILTNW